MATEDIEAVVKAPAGTRRAFFALTTEWQQPSAKTFAWQGAEQALKRFPALVEYAAVKLGRQRHARPAYRLTDVGLAVRHDLQQGSEGNG